MCLTYFLQVTLLQNWCIWCTSVVPYIVIAGRYLSGDEEFGIVTQTVMAFRMIVSGGVMIVILVAAAAR